MTPGHQQAAIKRLEALFKDVNLDQHKPRVVRLETKVDRCCEIHGNRYKENCAFRKNAPTTIVTTTITPTGRRSSLHMPMSVPQRDAHPSSFPSSLRKDFLGSSTSSIHKHDAYHRPIGTSSPNIRRDSLGRSMSSLKKDTSSTYNAPLRRDYVAKSMSNLQKPSLIRKDSDGSLSPMLSSTAKIREKLSSSGDLHNTLSRGYSSVTPKGVGFKDDLRAGSLSSLGSHTRMSPSYDSRKFSADSLENLNKRHSWDPTRRGSSGSSGGWDDPIWEENDYETSVDEVTWDSLMFYVRVWGVCYSIYGLLVLTVETVLGTISLDT